MTDCNSCGSGTVSLHDGLRKCKSCGDVEYIGSGPTVPLWGVLACFVALPFVIIYDLVSKLRRRLSYDY